MTDPVRIDVLRDTSYVHGSAFVVYRNWHRIKGFAPSSTSRQEAIALAHEYAEDDRFAGFEVEVYLPQV